MVMLIAEHRGGVTPWSDNALDSRTAWGQCRSLLLHCNGLSPSTLLRSGGAPTTTVTQSEIAEAVEYRRDTSSVERGIDLDRQTFAPFRGTAEELPPSTTAPLPQATPLRSNAWCGSASSRSWAALSCRRDSSETCNRVVSSAFLSRTVAGRGSADTKKNYTVPTSKYNVKPLCRARKSQHLMRLPPDVVSLEQPLELLGCQRHHFHLKQPRPDELLRLSITLCTTTKPLRCQ